MGTWIKRHKVWSSVIGIFALLIIIGAASGGGAKKSSASSSSTTSAPATNPNPASTAEQGKKVAEDAATKRREAAAAKRAEETKEAEEHAAEAKTKREHEAQERREHEPKSVGSGHAEGEYAIAQASGESNDPSQIALKLNATPAQSAQVSWDLVCQESGGGVGNKSGQSTLSLPTTEPLPTPSGSESCTVSANAQLSGNGTIEITILG